MSSYRSLVNIDESEERAGRIASFLTRFSPKTALDVGCSSGFLVKGLRALGVEAYGLDVDGSRFLEDVRTSLFVVDAGKDTFPFPHGKFDLITALTSLDYVQNYPHALDEVGKASKESGYFLMTFATDPRMKFQARPNVFKKEFWIGELAKRGFSYEKELAEDYVYEVAIKPEIKDSHWERLPRDLLMLWRKARHTSIDCIVAHHKESIGPGQAPRQTSA